MNNRIITQYCRMVGKNLVCSKATKTRLLNGLKDSLADFPDSDILTFQDLENSFGSTAQIAEELQQAVSMNEKKSVLKRQKRSRLLIMSIVACFSIILLLFALHFFRTAPYTIVNTIQEG